MNLTRVHLGVEEPLTIAVTQTLIDEGKKINCGDCPVALAVREATGAIWSYAMSVYIAATVRGEETCWRTPREAVLFMTDFDAGRPVSPFGFDLSAAVPR